MQPVGDHEPCELLAWDSEFWRRRIARVRGDHLTPARVDRIDAWCNDNRVDCVYFLGRADDPATTLAAEQVGFHFVDVRLTLEADIGAATPSPPPRPGLSIRACEPADVAVLETIARISHRDSRFYFDGRFPRERCDDLYACWIRTCCGGSAGTVLVATSEALPVGYVAISFDPGVGDGSISLLGVAEPFRGRGIGQRLVEAAREWLRERGACRVSVVTQGRNIAAQRLYQRGGFLVRSSLHWYHKWYRAEPTELAR